MSKFIRTKDGIYELKENMTIEKGIYTFFGKIYNTPEKHLFRNDKDLGEFVSQAETIEELCDEFHIEFDSLWEPKELLYSKYYHFDIAKRNLEDNETLYGVIHIKGKGLIYVAKLNEKGDLELI